MLILSWSTIRYFRVSSWLLSLCHHPTGCVGKICIWITNICMHMRLWSNCTQKSDIDESKRSPTSNGFISRASFINMEALYNSWKTKRLRYFHMKFYYFLFQIKKEYVHTVKWESQNHMWIRTNLESKSSDIRISWESAFTNNHVWSM